jgi:hypothetical protein
VDQRGSGTHLDAQEQSGADHGRQQQREVERAEMAASERHGERIGGERQRQQQGASRVEAGRVRPAAIDRQEAIGEKKSQHAERHDDEKDRPPAERSDQDAAERGAERGADRRHGADQPHGAAGPLLRHRLADHRQRKRHHDGGAKALRGPPGKQQPERRRDAAQERGQREQHDSGKQQPAAADDVAEPSGADDQAGDGEQIGQHDPLGLLEGRRERLGQGRQGDIGDAAAERGQQHRERQAGERKAGGRHASALFRVFCND